MEKTALSVLAFCLGATATTSGVAHAEAQIDLQTLKVLEENQISPEEYRAVAERFPGVMRNTISGGNYDTFNSSISAGNYDTFNSSLTSGNYDTFNSSITSGNYDTFNSSLTAGNYSSIDVKLFRELEARMPAPQADD